MVLEDLPVPVGDFVLKNAQGKQMQDGTYYHYSTVCNLLNGYRDKEIEKHDEILKGVMKLFDEAKVISNLFVSRRFNITYGEALKVADTLQRLRLIQMTEDMKGYEKV